jgi:hypothetical protein
VALREPEVGERQHLAEDPVGHLTGDAIGRHAGEEPVAEPLHLLLRPLRAHRTAQLIGVGRGEACYVHGDLHELLLEQRHSERLLQRALEQGVVVGDLVHPVAAPDVGVHGPTLDGAGPDERHLDHQVVELPGLQPGQCGHLRARLHLEHPDRVGPLQHLEHGRVGGLQLVELDLLAVVLGDQVDHQVQCGEHAQPEQVELDQAGSRAVVLVPLDDRAALHPGPLDGHHLGDGPVADDHAAGVDAEVAGEAQQVVGKLDDLVWHSGGRERGVAHRAVPAFDLLAPRVLLARGEPQRLRHVTHRGARAVGDHVGHLCGASTAVAAVDVLDRLLAAAGLDVEVDVGVTVPGRGQETLEQQPVGHGVDVGDAEREADGRIGGRPPALAEDVGAAAELDDVVNDQEVAGEILLLDDLQFAFDHLYGLWVLGVTAVAAGDSAVGQLPQPARLRVARRDVERR